MNHLNSVLFEGTLTEDPVSTRRTEKIARCTFYVKYVRRWKQGEINREEHAIFRVLVYGHQSEMCMEHLKAGRGVRVVGRLAQDAQHHSDHSVSHGHVYIVAEHVEFRSVTKTE